MSRGRLNIGPLVAALNSGLRKRSLTGEEEPDTFARRALLIIPLAAGGAMIVTRTPLAAADQLTDSAAILVGALIAAFGTVAVWRERLTQRDRSVELVSRRALDEAAAHILTSTLATLLGLVFLIAVANIDPGKSDDLLIWGEAVLSGLGLALYVYVMLTLVIVVNLLWDGYVEANNVTDTQSKSGDARRHR
ncbi:hypothetical protein [Nocardioides sp. Soil777]|uniref:hypothetical protein n=1 Tax=Nocardioides sp. Soil777 TaxID=1736409 RepID=UPI0012FC579F|nr:hypothetical protein [Nocardioides sp. Soil777]